MVLIKNYEAISCCEQIPTGCWFFETLVPALMYEAPVFLPEIIEEHKTEDPIVSEKVKSSCVFFVTQTLQFGWKYLNGNFRFRVFFSVMHTITLIIQHGRECWLNL